MNSGIERTQQNNIMQSKNEYSVKTTKVSKIKHTTMNLLLRYILVIHCILLGEGYCRECKRTAL